jgi:two-component system, NtrC family, response regulator AtoC
MAHDGSYLLAFTGDSSQILRLPPSGDFLIGSSPQADWSPGAEAPDRLATINLMDKTRSFIPTGTDTDWPTAINGLDVRIPQTLYSGDTITLGDIRLVYHGPRRQPLGGTVVDAKEFRIRLAQETERCTRMRRSLSVLLVDLGTNPGADSTALLELLRSHLRQVDFVSAVSRHELAVAMPDTDTQAQIPSARVLRRITAQVPAARAGVSLCPADASDPDALFVGARRAAQQAHAGELLSLAQISSIFPAGPHQLVAAEPAMQELLALVRQLAPTPLPVLIAGDTGVGKEFIAQALHHWSPRHTKKLVTINCAAVAESLFESELFGHERGAFTGATENKPGLLETAGGGTVLLDEIGECPAAVQAKLLRAIETRKFCRVGSVVERSVDIRILAATNRNLADEVAAGRFRNDLFYRLNAAVIEVPPLSHRPLDIPVLARLLLAESCQRLGRGPAILTDEAIRRLGLHDWPGNVRELRNVLDYSLATLHGDLLDARNLPDQVAGTTAPWLASDSSRPGFAPTTAASELHADRQFATLKEELQHLEKTRIIQALSTTGGVQNKAARLLGMPLRTFVSRLQQYGIHANRGERRK